MTTSINNWPMAKKVLVAFGMLAALFLSIAGLAIYENHKLSSISNRHVERGIAGTLALSNIIVDIKEERLVTWTYYSSPTPADATQTIERQQKTKAALLHDIEEYSKIAGDDFQPKVRELRTAVDDMHDVTDRIFERQDRGSPELLQVVRGEGRQRADRALDVAAELQLMAKSRAEKADAEGRAFANLGFVLTLIVSGIVLAGLLFIGRILTRTVAHPMSELATVTGALAQGRETDVPHQERKDEIGDLAKAVVGVRQLGLERAAADARIAQEQRAVTESLNASLKRLGAGDLTADIKTDFPADYRELQTNFNAALANLRELIGTVSASTGNIRSGSSEIAQASEDLARRTESNAASLEETAAAVTQMDSRLKETAQAANQTVARADQTKDTVSSGREVADEAVRAMGRVSDSAKGIDSVIEGLDKIAFQTRVLAMNAAVEAGRAGEAGRGFAVVADLVSALAMRAEEEAKRARDQLTVTQADVVTAVAAVEKVDGALQDISGDVEQVHQLLATIAAENAAQASAISEINAAVASMDRATQQNAAMVEETSAAARNLTQEVNSLADQASQFLVEEAGSAPARSRSKDVPAVPTKVAAPTRSPDSFSTVDRSLAKLLPAANGKVLSNGAAHDDWNAF